MPSRSHSSILRLSVYVEGVGCLSLFLLLCSNPRRVEDALNSALNTWYYGVSDASDASKMRGCAVCLGAQEAGRRREPLQ